MVSQTVVKQNVHECFFIMANLRGGRGGGGFVKIKDGKVAPELPCNMKAGLSDVF